MASFTLGLMCKPLYEQAPEIGEEKAARFQTQINAVFLLSMAGYLTTAQKNKTLDKIAKQIQKALQA